MGLTSSKPILPQDVHIVVVGGGYAGAQLALRLLDAKAKFTLVDGRDCFHHNVASVRAIAVPGLAPLTFIPFEETFGDHFKRGIVSAINSDKKTIELKAGEEISYDYLVIATGSKGPFPGQVGFENGDEAIAHYEKYAHRVKDADTIVVVGGGAVGVEIASEIATEYPDKEVTLIHSKKSLVMDELSDKFQLRMQTILKELDVRVIFGEMVTNLKDFEDDRPGVVKTDKGSSVAADLVIVCTGLQVQSDACGGALVSAKKPNGALNVNEYFEVDGYEDIFAIGDCCASGDHWMAYIADYHAKHLFENIICKCQGTILKSYQPQANKGGGMIVVSMGRNNCVGQTAGGYTIPEFIVKKLKAKDLFIERFWGILRQKMPKLD